MKFNFNKILKKKAQVRIFDIFNFTEEILLFSRQFIEGMLSYFFEK